MPLLPNVSRYVLSSCEDQSSRVPVAHDIVRRLGPLELATPPRLVRIAQPLLEHALARPRRHRLDLLVRHALGERPTRRVLRAAGVRRAEEDVDVAIENRDEIAIGQRQLIAGRVSEMGESTTYPKLGRKLSTRSSSGIHSRFAGVGAFQGVQMTATAITRSGQY